MTYETINNLYPDTSSLIVFTDVSRCWRFLWDIFISFCQRSHVSIWWWNLWYPFGPFSIIVPSGAFFLSNDSLRSKRNSPGYRFSWPPLNPIPLMVESINLYVRKISRKKFFCSVNHPAAVSKRMSLLTAWLKMKILLYSWITNNGFTKLPR